MEYRKVICIAIFSFFLGYHFEAEAQVSKTARSLLQWIEKEGGKVVKKFKKLPKSYNPKGVTSKPPRPRPHHDDLIDTIFKGEEPLPQNQAIPGTFVTSVFWVYQNTSYNGRIMMIGGEGMFRVRYSDLAGNNIYIDQAMYRDYHENCSIFLVGSNPVFANTQVPVAGYLPDSFCFQQTAWGTWNVITCQNAGCATVLLQ